MGRRAAFKTQWKGNTIQKHSRVKPISYLCCELMVLGLAQQGMGPYVTGGDLGFLYDGPEKSFMVVFNRLRLPE